jgi:hypothetical protein
VHIFPNLHGIATRNNHPHEQTLLRPSKDIPQGCLYIREFLLASGSDKVIRPSKATNHRPHTKRVKYLLFSKFFTAKL